MARVQPRVATIQVGEFAVGVAAAYAAVAAAWSLSGSVWPLVLAAAFVVGVAVALEVRYGSKAAGFVAGLLPTALLTGGVFVAMSLVAFRLG